MGLNPLLNLAAKFLGGAGASQQPSTIQKTNGERNPAEALKQVNTSIGEADQQEGADTLSRQVLEQLSTAESTATAPLVATTAAAELSAPTAAALTITDQTEATPAAAIELRISQKAVESLRPILSALKSLVQSILPELNLQLADTAKPVLQALLSQANSNSAGTPTATPNPA